MRHNSTPPLYLSAVFDGEEVKLLLHAEVIEGQVDAALGLGDDQPHAVHVVAVLLGVVGRQQHPRRRGKVEETRDCGAAPKQTDAEREAGSWGEGERQTERDSETENT